MGDAQGRRGEELRAKAEKKLSGWGLFGNKYEDAADLYEGAANAFKLAKRFDDAAACYDKLADCFVKLDSAHESATAMSSAAACVKKNNPKKAVSYYAKAADYFCNLGRLAMAAKAFKESAEILESAGDQAGALEYYEKAGDLFETENQSSETNKCNLKMASIHAELEQYNKAIKLFEQVALKSVDNNLLKYSVKGYLLQAGICHMCMGDAEGVKEAVEKFEDMDVTFSGTRECKFLQDLAEAMEEGDTERFTEVTAEFDSMTRLDNWKTKLLLRAKKAIGEAEDDLT